MLIGYPAHRAFVAFAKETVTITESSVPATPAALPAAPTDLTVCGYVNLPDRRRGLNNSYGNAIGSANALYAKKGCQTPGFTLTIRGGGALALLDYITRGYDPDGDPIDPDDLRYLCFAVGVPGVWTEMYRFCKVGQLGIQARESPQGEAAEIEFTLTVEAMAFVQLSSPLSPDVPTLVNAMGAPLFWHDVRTASISGTSFRKFVAGINVTINHNLERKGEREDWGDDAPLSRTNYDLLPQLIQVTGELQMHTRLASSFWTAADNSMQWGDIVLNISDTQRGGSQTFDLTLGTVMPQDEVGDSIEPGSQIIHRVPFVARTFTLTPQESEE